MVRASLTSGLPRRKPDRPYHIPYIEMSPELQESLDHASKLDRSPALAARIMADGERQARAFLKQRGQLIAPDTARLQRRKRSRRV